MEHEALIVNEVYGEDGAKELALAYAVTQDLCAQYPGYIWRVTCEGGVVKVVLAIPEVIRKGMGEPGYLMPSRVAEGQDGVKKVRNAAGEILERYRLPRGAAPPDWIALARMNGPDMSNAILKSRF